jgi:hypothetical protein
MKFLPLMLLLGLLAVGCQSSAPTTEATTQQSSTAKESTQPAQANGESAAETSEAVKPGMSMAEVKKIKGAPKDTRHDHGPNNSELDFWVYDDQTVKFQDGKVVE